MQDEQPRLLTQRDGNVFIIVINRPEAKNAFDKAAAESMNNAVDEFEADPSLFVAIITGAGGTFSAGADLKAVARGERPSTEARGGFGVFRKRPAKPLIAAVEGYAIAGGMELCLACDLIVAASDAKMGLPEVRHGVVAMGGGLFRLPRRIPYHIAMELALTGDIRDAAFFHQHGLINRVVKPGTALAEARKLAASLMVSSPLAVAATKTIVQAGSDWTEEEGWNLQAEIARPAIESEDRAEGLKAFAEKRPPHPDGYLKLPHLWPGKLLQAGRGDCRSFSVFS